MSVSAWNSASVSWVAGAGHANIHQRPSNSNGVGSGVDAVQQIGDRRPARGERIGAVQADGAGIQRLRHHEDPAFMREDARVGEMEGFAQHDTPIGPSDGIGAARPADLAEARSWCSASKTDATRLHAAAKGSATNEAGMSSPARASSLDWRGRIARPDAADRVRYRGRSTRDLRAAADSFQPDRSRGAPSTSAACRFRGHADSRTRQAQRARLAHRGIGHQHAGRVRAKSATNPTFQLPRLSAPSMQIFSRSAGHQPRDRTAARCRRATAPGAWRCANAWAAGSRRNRLRSPKARALHGGEEGAGIDCAVALRIEPAGANAVARCASDDKRQFAPETRAAR